MNLEIDDSKVVLMLEQGEAGIGRALARRLVRVGQELEKHVKSNELSGQRMQVRTGTGRRSVFHRVEADGNEVFVVVGADLAKAKYMRAQEKGATITPKNAANLTIPVGEAKTANGVARFSARQLIASPQSFGFVGTFARNRIIFGKRESGQAEALFVLRPSVTLKPVGYLTNTLVEKSTFIGEEVGKAIDEGLDGR